MAKKILIFHTSVGLGHKFIAQNIGWNLEQAGFVVKLADIGKVQEGKFKREVVAAHKFINKYLPFVWGWLYAWGHYIILPFRVFIAGFNYLPTKKLVDEYQPDLIIATQTSASAVIAFLKKKGFYRGPFGIAFSDFHLHPYWLYSRADFYLANIEEQKIKMIAHGIPAEKIFVCGIVLRPKLQVDTQAVKNRLGITSEDRVILIGTGSLGLGFKLDDLKKLSALENTKIIFACGHSQELYDNIKSLNYPDVIPLGFYEPMDELYVIADVFVGKPGGLSTSESLQWNLPLLVTFTLPGQEEMNMKFLLKKKLVMPRPKNLAKAVEEELASHAFKRQLQTNPNAELIVGQSRVLVEAIKRIIG